MIFMINMSELIMMSMTNDLVNRLKMIMLTMMTTTMMMMTGRMRIVTLSQHQI